MIKHILFTSFFLLTLASVAQEARHYNFTHYTGESGLISYQVNTSLQDEDGYIWIATNEGLQRYDGIRYKNFRHKDNDPTTIPSKSVLQIITDKKKNLWLLTMDGKAGKRAAGNLLAPANGLTLFSQTCVVWLYMPTKENLNHAYSQASTFVRSLDAF